MPQSSPVHLLQTLSIQISGETKIQSPYHGKWVSTSEIQSHQANSEKCYGWMSAVAGWQRQHLAREQLPTSVPLRMTDGRERAPALSPAEQRCSWPGSAAVYTTPRSYHHNLWSWFQQEWKIRGEQGNAEKPDKLEQYLERRWARCQWNNFQQQFNFIHVQHWVYRLMATGLGKRAPEETSCLLKHPWGPRRRGQDCLHALCLALAVPISMENPVLHLSRAGDGSGSRSLPISDKSRVDSG